MRALSLFLVISALSFSQDCSHLWQHDLRTGTNGPKGYMGDTHAAYGVFSFFNDHSKYYVLKGQYPRARFFSVEVYKGRKNFPLGSLFDAKIHPDEGSINPFFAGVSMEASNRNYSVVVSPQKKPQNQKNEMFLSPKDKYASIWIRYYSPSQGVIVTPSDLPRIEAYDVKTGKPTSCPRTWTEPHTTPWPQALGLVSHKPKTEFPFKLFQVNWAGNSGVGKYSEGHSRMSFDEVAVIRFSPPSFDNNFPGVGNFPSGNQLRYWSLCAINMPANQGLMCFADYELQADAEGFITVAMGTGAKVREESQKRGYYFIPDMRPSNSKMVLFAFRNILPSSEFEQNDQYQGVYNPWMKVCSTDSFLSGNCEWW
jgi:hypothetical protein